MAPSHFMMRRVEFIGRQWNLFDITTLIVVLLFHILSLLAPFYFNWGAFWLFVALYFLTGLGVTLGYHRSLAHRSFKLPRWLEYFFAYCGVLALQGNPIEWVSTHRYHHQFTDTKKDPHSPLMGFWFSHIGWVVNNSFRFESYERRLKNVEDLKRQPYYRFLHRTYLLHSVVLGVLLYVTGGLPFLVWGMGVRTVVLYHVTFSVNSICHTWGSQVWDTGDLSRNNLLVALPTLGEGWHNNHHAFDYSARQGLEWWQVDITWCCFNHRMDRKVGTVYINPKKLGTFHKPCLKEMIAFLNCLAAIQLCDDKCSNKNRKSMGSINYHLQRLSRGRK